MDFMKRPMIICKKNNKKDEIQMTSSRRLLFLNLTLNIDMINTIISAKSTRSI